MDWFIHQQNLERFRRLLAHPADETQRQQLIKLLAEEEAKAKTKLPPHADDAAA
jgi:hypothetical protein